MVQVKKLKGWLTTKEAAEQSGLTDMTIWLRIKMGEISFKDLRRVGKLYIISEKAVNALKRRGRGPASQYPKKEKAE